MKKILFSGLLLFSLVTGFTAGYAYQLYLEREECLKATFSDSVYDISNEEIENITKALNSEADDEEPMENQEIINNEKEPQKTGSYVGSKNSNKFYSVDCRYAKLIKEENKVSFDSIEEGERKGKEYVDCEK